MADRHPGLGQNVYLDVGLTRSNSEDTLVTENEYDPHGQRYPRRPLQQDIRGTQDRSGDISELSSLFTAESEETVTNNVKVLGHPITSYTRVRELPIVSSFLQPGVLIFSSLRSMEVYSQKNLTADETERYHAQGLGVPLLQTSTPMLNIFKINAPFMLIHRFNQANEKTLFCKVYFRILTNNVTCYILIFLLENDELRTVVLMNNGIKPSVDLILENTKLRATGVTGTTSTFANGFIQLYILQDSAPTLCDDMHIRNTIQTINSSIKNVKVSVGESNELYRCLRFQKKTSLNKLMNKGKSLTNTPLATFVDDGDEKVKGANLFRNGTIKLFETTNEYDNNTNTLMITSILLMLREQETRKSRGSNKPTFVNHHNNANNSANIS